MEHFQIAKLVMLKQLRPRKLRRSDLPDSALLNTVEGCVRFRADARLSFTVIEKQLAAVLSQIESENTLRRLVSRSRGSSLWDRASRLKARASL